MTCFTCASCGAHFADDDNMLCGLIVTTLTIYDFTGLLPLKDKDWCFLQHHFGTAAQLMALWRSPLLAKQWGQMAHCFALLAEFATTIIGAIQKKDTKDTRQRLRKAERQTGFLIQCAMQNWERGGGLNWMDFRWMNGRDTLIMRRILPMRGGRQYDLRNVWVAAWG